MTNDLTDEVKAIGSLNFEGNIIPIEWLNHIRLPNNKPDLISIFLLSDIIYWYRPTTIRDEFSGQVIGYKKKFKSDLLQKGYKDLEDLFGLTKDQIKRSLQRLEQLNLIKRIFRNINSNGSSLANVMFIQIFPNNISNITEKKIDMVMNHHTPVYISPEVRGLIATPPMINPHTYTETTTKITTKNTLSLKKSSNSKVVEQNIFEREKEMINIWDRILREGEKPSVPSHARLVNLKNLLEESLENDLTNWESYCLTIKKSKFLMGGGANNWKADLTWAIKKENLIRVLENYYHQREEKTTEGKNEEIIEDAEETCNDPTWNNVKEILKRKKGEDTYKSWFKKLSLKGYENDKALLIAPSKFIKEWILTNYMHDIIDSFKQTDFKIKEVEIFIESREGELA
jgi:hypothetical protein